MRWTAPSEKDTENAALEKRPSDSADHHGCNLDNYDDDPHDATGLVDFVHANPPFNVNTVDPAMRVSARCHSEGTPQDLLARQDHERLKDMVGANRRFAFCLPRKGT